MTPEQLIASQSDATAEYKYVRPNRTELDSYKHLCENLAVNVGELTIAMAYNNYLEGREYADLSEPEKRDVENSMRPVRRVTDMLTRAATDEINLEEEIAIINKQKEMGDKLSQLI